MLNFNYFSSTAKTFDTIKPEYHNFNLCLFRHLLPSSWGVQ